jgi:CBS domain-containing protein
MIQNEAFVPFELQLVGVLSRKDLKKGGSVVRDVMTSPPIALGATDKAFVAGHTMLDNKIHRVPIVDEDGKAIGIVTRTDLFWALASQSDRAQWFSEHGIDL